MYYDVIFSGFGGQGVLLIGDILAQAAMLENRHVTWMPSYGVEIRGGAASCTVVISSQKIGSPITEEPCGLLAMSKPALLKFQHKVKKGGLLVVNTSFVEPEMITREDVIKICLPASEISYRETGDYKMANAVLLGAFVSLSRVVTLQGMEEALGVFFKEEKQKLLPLMIKALQYGSEFVCAGMNGDG
ncbi:MAG: 2-oxoacid:ferredoxin oxidoreductase subunit gamma [Dethiobacter sp.]|nr:MAG: 2-oxoacid:ferredoxin oxidoreductase subunit gamma [Dethiobacter sp.]